MRHELYIMLLALAYLLIALSNGGASAIFSDWTPRDLSMQLFGASVGAITAIVFLVFMKFVDRRVPERKETKEAREI